MQSSFRSIEELLRKTNPETPVYCVYPHVYQQSTRHFIDGFPGRVLFAIKSNNHPIVVKLLHKFGIRHFDCASLPEIELVNELCPDSTIYYMNPVRLNGHARAAQREHGVRHFMIDHSSGLAPLVDDGELLAEPGRALSAPGLSAVVRVLLRKAERIYYSLSGRTRFNGFYSDDVVTIDDQDSLPPT